MIAAAAVLAVVVATSTERNALMSHWAQASRLTIPVNRRLAAGTAPSQAALASIHRLAAAELSVPGRYALANKAQPVANPPWWQRFVASLRDWLNWLKRTFFGRIRLNPNAAAIIGDLVIALLAFAVAVAAIRLLVAYRRRGRRTLQARPLSPAADAATLYALAAERADRGEYAAAAQLLFRATLAHLDLRGTVRDDASATVGEIRRRLPERDLIGAFDAVAAAFVAGTYAERPLDAAHWQRAREAYLSLARGPA